MARMNHERSMSTSVSLPGPVSREQPQAQRWSMRRKLKVGYTILAAVVLVFVAGLVTLSAVGGNHTIRSVTYAQVPPHSGDHSPVWQRCGFYSEPVGNEHAVHSLEHGVVWITYQPDLPAAQIDVLRQLARSDEYLIVSPYPGLPAPVVVSAWERQLQLPAASDPRLGPTVAEYRNSPLAPEPDGGCEGPNLWFSGSTGNPER
jgi:hypothetical protein